MVYSSHFFFAAASILPVIAYPFLPKPSYQSDATLFMQSIYKTQLQFFFFYFGVNAPFPFWTFPLSLFSLFVAIGRKFKRDEALEETRGLFKAFSSVSLNILLGLIVRYAAYFQELELEFTARDIIGTFLLVLGLVYIRDLVSQPFNKIGAKVYEGFATRDVSWWLSVRRYRDDDAIYQPFESQILWYFVCILTASWEVLAVWRLDHGDGSVWVPPNPSSICDMLSQHFNCTLV